MEMKIVGVTIAAFVSLVVLAAVLMPVLDDATATTDTFENEGYFSMTTLDADSSYKLFWDHTAPFQVTINDTDVITLDGLGQYSSWTVLASDEFSLRLLNEPNNARLQLYGGTGWGFVAGSIPNGVDITAVVENGDLTISNSVTGEGAYSHTETVPERLYGINTTGDYVMKKSNVPAYLLEDSSIITLCGVTQANNLEACVFAEGTVEDGLDYTLFRPAGQSETAVFSNEEMTYTAVNGYEGLVSLEKVKFDVTLTGGTLEPTYTYFIVPAEVTAERSVHFTDNENAIFAAIPLLIIVALLIGVLAVVIRSRE